MNWQAFLAALSEGVCPFCQGALHFEDPRGWYACDSCPARFSFMHWMGAMPGELTWTNVEIRFDNAPVLLGPDIGEVFDIKAS